MRIAVLASEGAPYIKSGGLGDVIQALPRALAKLPGNEVALFLPYYKRILDNPGVETELVTHFYVALGWRQQYAGVHRLKHPAGGVQVYFIDNLYYFGNRSHSGYGDQDDGERFAYFSKACLDALVALNFAPHIIHCNDWQTALVPVYLKAQYYPFFPRTKCVFTIHNIEYQGWANGDFFDDVLALPWEYRQRLDMGGGINFMKGAIETADWVTTVSETYAQELMYPYFAHGLSFVLSGNRGKFTGITNGIDTDVVNPETDPALHTRYNVNTFTEGKALCKAHLQSELALPQRSDVPLMVTVTRLAGHKGLDLLRHIARKLLWEEDCQMVILGTGEAHYENFFRDLQREFPNKFVVNLTFDSALASQIYAGGDIYLMPSKSEPCGLSQMNAMRYGTVPVVHATGGLADTVPPADEQGEGGLGFTFQSYNADDFLGAIRRCLQLYRTEPEAFRTLQKRDMEQDFSWDKPAAEYLALYHKLLNK